jgi:hypothetical protein
MVWPKTTLRVTDLKLLRYDKIYVPSHIKIFQRCVCYHQVSCSSRPCYFKILHFLYNVNLKFLIINHTFLLELHLSLWVLLSRSKLWFFKFRNWSDFDRVSSLICGNKNPTRCNRWFLLQILLLAQYISGTIMPIIRSSRVLYRRLLPVVFDALVCGLLQLHLVEFLFPHIF